VWRTPLSTDVLNYTTGDITKTNNFVCNNYNNELNRFLSEYFIRLHENGFSNDSKIWLKVLNDCKDIAYLRVLSCMQLMSKYTLHCKVINIQVYKKTHKMVIIVFG